MPLVLPSKRVGYTIEEVAKHSTAKSLWVIINRKVYDVTKFHARHPGGPTVLLQMGGKDATAAAGAAHKSALPANLMWEFCIGSVVRAKAAVASQPEEPSSPPSQKARQKAFAQKRTQSWGPVEQIALPDNGEAVSSASVRGFKQRLGDGNAESPVESEEDRLTCSEAVAANGSEFGHTNDDGLFDTMGEDDALGAAARAISEILKTDPRLGAWLRSASPLLLERPLRKFLADAFGQVAHGRPAALNLKQSHLEPLMEDLVDPLLAALQRPVPLGEDIFAFALTSLATGARSHDHRVARFLTRFQSLVFSLPSTSPPAAAGHHHGHRGGSKEGKQDEAAASSSRGKPRPEEGSPVASSRGKLAAAARSQMRPEELEGTWETGDGSRLTVDGGQCTFQSKRGSFPITSRDDGVLTMNGWAVASLTSKTVQWKKSGRTLEWTRSPPA